MAEGSAIELSYTVLSGRGSHQIFSSRWAYRSEWADPRPRWRRGWAGAYGRIVER